MARRRCPRLRLSLLTRLFLYHAFINWGISPPPPFLRIHECETTFQQAYLLHSTSILFCALTADHTECTEAEEASREKRGESVEEEDGSRAESVGGHARPVFVCARLCDCRTNAAQSGGGTS